MDVLGPLLALTAMVFAMTDTACGGECGGATDFALFTHATHVQATHALALMLLGWRVLRLLMMLASIGPMVLMIVSPRRLEPWPVHTRALERRLGRCGRT